MRYTIDEFDEYDDRPSPSGDPLFVEVLGPEAGPRVIRSPEGAVFGMEAGRESGRPTLLFYGDNELLERIEGLRQAIRELAYTLDALEVDVNGAEPEDPDTEAVARTKLNRLSLLAHAAAAIELETEQG